MGKHGVLWKIRNYYAVRAASKVHHCSRCGIRIAKGDPCYCWGGIYACTRCYWMQVRFCDGD